MLKIILGVVVGFIVWSIIWVGGSAILEAVWLDYSTSMQTLKFSSSMLIIALIRSFIASILSGFIAVIISKEFSKTTIGLGVLLLAFGLFVQIASWSVFPVWYHLVFLILLIPLTILGGKLKAI